MSATYLTPSTIHYLHSGHIPDSALSTTSDSDIMKISRNIVERREHPKLQVVAKDGHWFALNTSQLELCRRLERDGKCSCVRVDVVPLTEVPSELRKMMVVRVEESKDTVITKTADAPVSRSTVKGYHKLTQGEKKVQGHDVSSGSDDDDSASSSDSEFDSDSECDWSDEIHGSSDLNSSDDDKTSDDERECLL